MSQAHKRRKGILNADWMHREHTKQTWQAHFMAAAYRASEEEWERASSYAGDAQSPSPPSAPPAMPMAPFGQFSPHPSFSPPIPYGFPMPYPPPVMIPFAPSGPMTPPAYSAPPPPQQHSAFVHSATPGPPGPDTRSLGYSFGRSSQSVFGNDFGPPSNHRPVSTMPAWSKVGSAYGGDSPNLQNSPAPHAQSWSRSHYPLPMSEPDFSAGISRSMSQYAIPLSLNQPRGQDYENGPTQRKATRSSTTHFAS